MLTLDVHIAHLLPPSGPSANGASQRSLPHQIYKKEAPFLILLYSFTLYLALFSFIVHISFNVSYIFVET